jgi:hypothetical protein
MARGRLTIHDVPPEIRAKGAAQARQQLHMLLSNPHITAEQQKDLRDRLAWIARWEAAKVDDICPPPNAPPPPPAPPAPPARAPQNHVVEVAETLTVEDSMPGATPAD